MGLIFKVASIFLVLLRAFPWRTRTCRKRQTWSQTAARRRKLDTRVESPVQSQDQSCHVCPNPTGPISLLYGATTTLTPSAQSRLAETLSSAGPRGMALSKSVTASAQLAKAIWATPLAAWGQGWSASRGTPVLKSVVSAITYTDSRIAQPGASRGFAHLRVLVADSTEIRDQFGVAFHIGMRLNLPPISSNLSRLKAKS